MRYLVKMIEIVQYEVYVEADNVEDAEQNALDLYCSGDSDVEVTHQNIDEIIVEEENEDE